MRRSLNPDEAAAWAQVMASVRPMRGMTPAPTLLAPLPHAGGAGGARVAPVPAVVHPRTASKPSPEPARKREGRSNTLDASWDRRLTRGLAQPDTSLDLHGHTLGSAHALLDAGLDRALARGDRVLLLVTGKPPRPESERPHARGAIRAAVADWLAASRHADRIAAVRNAHPRHGGAGALYIVLRRPGPR